MKWRKQFKNLKRLHPVKKKTPTPSVGVVMYIEYFFLFVFGLLLGYFVIRKVLSVYRRFLRERFNPIVRRLAKLGAFFLILTAVGLLLDRYYNLIVPFDYFTGDMVVLGIIYSWGYMIYHICPEWKEFYAFWIGWILIMNFVDPWQEIFNGIYVEDIYYFSFILLVIYLVYQHLDQWMEIGTLGAICIIYFYDEDVMLFIIFLGVGLALKIYLFPQEEEDPVFQKLKNKSDDDEDKFMLLPTKQHDFLI